MFFMDLPTTLFCDFNLLEYLTGVFSKNQKVIPTKIRRVIEEAETQCFKAFTLGSNILKGV